MGSNCGCNGSNTLDSWFDWTNTSPKDPFELLAYASLTSNVGLHSYAASPSGSWAASPLALSTDPVCSALEADNQQMVADAAQWNFQHQTRNSLTTLAPPLNKVIFLRGGLRWNNTIQVDFGGSAATGVMLTFRDNYGTRGDTQGTIPVILFAGSYTGVKSFNITLKTLVSPVKQSVTY